MDKDHGPWPYLRYVCPTVNWPVDTFLGFFGWDTRGHLGPHLQIVGHPSYSGGARQRHPGTSYFYYLCFI